MDRCATTELTSSGRAERGGQSDLQCGDNSTKTRVAPLRLTPDRRRNQGRELRMDSCRDQPAPPSRIRRELGPWDRLKPSSLQPEPLCHAAGGTKHTGVWALQDSN